MYSMNRAKDRNIVEKFRLPTCLTVLLGVEGLIGRPLGHCRHAAAQPGRRQDLAKVC